MAKKSSRIEEIIEALCDERVVGIFTTRMQEKISQLITEQMDIKMKEITADLRETILNDTTQLVSNASEKLTNVSDNQTKINDERITKLENINIQQELLIFGLPTRTDQATITDNSHDESLVDLICSHVKKRLEHFSEP